MVSHPIKNLLEGLIDYAGLFPPAKLSMAPAVAEFARQRRTEEAWILSRFVVPTARLQEMEAAMAPHRSALDGRWSISALVGGDLEAARQEIDAFNARNEGRARVDSLEFKPADRDDIAAAALTFDGYEVFYELARGPELAWLMEAVATRGGSAKIRTGGVTADAFPSVADTLDFIEAAHAAGIPFKATAGLHHPLRGEYRLTYDDRSPSGTMHGFLNLFITAAFVHHGALDSANAKELLAERNAGALDFSAAGVSWNGFRLSADDLASARRDFVRSYGSCSFQEPVDDLRSLHLL